MIMNAKLFLIVMAIAFGCIAAKSRAPFDYEDEVSFKFIERGEDEKVSGYVSPLVGRV